MRDFRRSALAVDAASAAVCALLDGGKLLLFDGRKPLDPDAPQNQTPIAELFFDRPAFSRPVGGIARAHPIAPDQQVHRPGRPTWFRAVTGAGAPVFDGTVGVRLDGRDGVERYDLELDAAEVELDDVVRVERLTYVERSGRA